MKLLNIISALALCVGCNFARATTYGDPNNWNISLNYTNAQVVTTSAPDEIKELAKGLENDPLRIYNYVLTNFDYQPYWGSLKGYERAYYDQAGNDTDLCSLLKVLLEEAGHSPEFVEGWMSIPVEDAAKWLKIRDDLPFNNTGDPGWSNAVTAVFAPLTSGGIYYDTNVFYSGSKIAMRIYRTLLKVDIGGTVHILDPAFKEYGRVSPTWNASDLATITGYNQSTLISTLGGTAVTGGYKNFNESSLRNLLKNHSTNLVSEIQSNHRGKYLEELIGGYRRQVSEATSLPQQPSYSFTQNGAATANVPAHRKHYMRVQFGVIDKVFATADVAAKRLYFAFQGNGRAELFLDDIEIAEEATVGSSSARISLSVDHPYHATVDVFDFSDQEAVANQRDAIVTEIPKAFAPTFHDRWFTHLREEISGLQAQGVADNDPRILSRSLEMYGSSFIAQRVGYLNLCHSLSDGGQSYLIHDLGLCFQRTSYGLDWVLSAGASYGDEYWTNQTAELRKIQGAWSFFSSALEHGVIDQMQGDPGGASTVRGFSFANAQGQDILFATDANYSTVRSRLASGGWTSADLNRLDSQFNLGSGTVLLIHRNAPLTSGNASHDWSGAVYWYLPQANPGGAFIIDGLRGGTGLLNTVWSSIKTIFNGGLNFLGISTGTLTGAISQFFGFGNPISAEPVDLATGAYLWNGKDLSLGAGEAPKGLSFARSYNSLLNTERHELGNGWSHNWDMTIREVSHFPVQFGGRLPVDTAAQIVAAYVATNLASAGFDDAREVMGLMLTAHWGTDEQVGNVAFLKSAHAPHLYSRQPDGSYTPPPGNSGVLTKMGDDFSLAQRHSNTLAFDDQGGIQKVASITDQHGNSASVSYDGDHRVSSVSDCFGRSLTFNYSGDNLTSVSDSTGRSVSFGIDANGNQTSYTNADADTFTFGYDAENRITTWVNEKSETIARNFYNSIGKVERQHSEGNAAHEWHFYFTGFENIEQDPEGNQKHYFFDSRLNHTAFEDALGNRTAREFDAERQITRVTDPAGHYITFAYNNDLNLTAKNHYDPADTLLRIYGFSYDAQKRLHIATNPRGYTSTYTYNAAHQVTSVQRQNESGDTEFGYNPNGTLAYTRDQANNQTDFSYDAWHNVSRTDFPDGTFSTSVFNARGDATSITDARGKATTFAYNNRRMQTSVTNADGDTQTQSFDGSENLVSSTDYRNNSTTQTYNALNKLTGTTNALSQTSSIAYNGRDLASSATSPGGITVSTSYDAAGRSVGTTAPISSSTSGFDARGLPTSTTNALNEAVSNSFDALGQATSITNSRNETVIRSYDSNGNLTGITNGRGKTTTFVYDSLDRVTSATTPEGRQTSSTYTDRGQIHTLTEPSGQVTTMTYDLLGRVKTRTDDVGTLTYSRDNNGNITGITDGARSVSYVFDDLNRITSYTDENNQTIAYQFDKNGNLTHLTYPGGKTVQYTYDVLNRMSTVTDWNNRQTSYSYDTDGRLLTTTRPNGTKRKHTYDAEGRLTRVVEEDSNGYIIYRSDLRLDLVGKITSEFRIPKSRGLDVNGWTASYNDDDEIATHTAGAITHDADGNMTRAPLSPSLQATLTFNARNQLATVSGAGASYAYGVEGNRLSKAVGGVTTTFVTNPLGNLATTLMETAGGVTRYYIYGLGLIGHEENGTYRTYHFDPRGNTIALTKDDGSSITDRFEYSPYGETIY
ncbi:MAG: DUF6531 domain-containing protein, partial [Akkermansiaceae bacterium]